MIEETSFSFNNATFFSYMYKGVPLTKRIPNCSPWNSCRSTTTQYYYNRSPPRRVTLLLRRKATTYAKRQSTTITFPSRLFKTPALLCSVSPIVNNTHATTQFESTRRLQPPPRHATPSEIETAAAEPPQTSIKRLFYELLRIFDEWILEPLLTFRRFVHIVFIFAPVILITPAVLIGSRVEAEQDEKRGTLWWFDFLASQMERAGPTFIKLAQWIASRTDLFPLALCTRLSKLHSHVDPHPFSHTRHILREAFGRELHEVFSELDENPLGVGAIAQVYKAKLRPYILVRHMREQFLVEDNIITPDCVQTLDIDGKTPINIHTSVAIKVLHPKARQIVHRDLKIMEFFAKALTLIPTMHWISLPDEVRVFGEMMRDQLDLRIEASHLERFNKLFADTMNVEFPKPVMAFTTKDMLIEEYENGIPLNAFLEQAAFVRQCDDDDIKPVYDNKIANIGLNAFLHMLIFYNFVHADLHPGNIMIKFYKPKAHHPVQKAWSRAMGRYLKDDGEVAVERILAVRDDPVEMHKELLALEDEGYSPRLVFIDAGLVNELNDVNRRNFLDLFQAIAQFDGYRAGELMVERCRTPELVIEPEVFALRMQNLILGLKQNTFNLGAVRIGNLLHNAMNMVRAHHVKLEGDFVNVVVSIMLLEGIGRQLNPDLDLFKSALPVLRDYSIKDHGKATIEGVVKDVQMHGSAPHWLKVWIFLELRNLFLRNERENEWLQMCDFLCFNN
ncbi:hypothetical protein BDA99DRAFT_222135 [Phascolomyces articulosus]|uniref:ABC1 atypical kinase-like domain-containing protein n=1 Tax=Phascolomyces articulosus TaxID=60185 RepID=A0AAD5JPZ9_9FUNG|nr:hypothetical protein BDA99DRAFT_222135 [Phascolomyces articulosus]